MCAESFSILDCGRCIRVVAVSRIPVGFDDIRCYYAGQWTIGRLIICEGSLSSIRALGRVQTTNRAACLILMANCLKWNSLCSCFVAF